MTYFDRVKSFTGTVNASENAESIVKVAEENGILRNDMIVYHNLTAGNIFTGENLIKVAEDEAESPLLVAVEVYQDLSSGNIDENKASEMIKSAGLENEDFNSVADAIEKQAEDAGIFDNQGIIADQDVWEKIAEAHEYLVAADINPVTAIQFASEFQSADSEDAQEKVASSFEGLDDDVIDKIAEVVDFLGDIEGVPTLDLMTEYSKEAGAIGETAGKVIDAAKKFGKNFSGRSVKDAESNLATETAKTNRNNKTIGTLKNTLSSAKDDQKNARVMAGVGVGGLALGAGGASALHKSASAVTADDAVWDKVAEAYDFLSEAGLEPVTSMEFAETFSAANTEQEQDKIASEFDGIDEESVDKIAEAFNYLGDVEGVPLSTLMNELDKVANEQTMVQKGVGKAKDFVEKAKSLGNNISGKAKSFGRDYSGENVKNIENDLAEESSKVFKNNKKTSRLRGELSDAKNAQSNAKKKVRLVAGGTAATAVTGGAGAYAYNKNKH